MDSVHSLPVTSNSSKHNLTKNQNSSGNAPQVSYADIARAATINMPPSGVLSMSSIVPNMLNASSWPSVPTKTPSEPDKLPNDYYPSLDELHSERRTKKDNYEHVNPMSPSALSKSKKAEAQEETMSKKMMIVKYVEEFGKLTENLSNMDKALGCGETTSSFNSTPPKSTTSSSEKESSSDNNNGSESGKDSNGNSKTCSSTSGRVTAAARKSSNNPQNNAHNSLQQQSSLEEHKKQPATSAAQQTSEEATKKSVAVATVQCDNELSSSSEAESTRGNNKATTSNPKIITLQRGHSEESARIKTDRPPKNPKELPGSSLKVNILYYHVF